MNDKKQQVKRKPNAQDSYKGAKDSGIKFVLVDKDGKKKVIKR